MSRFTLWSALLAAIASILWFAYNTTTTTTTNTSAIQDIHPSNATSNTNSETSESMSTVRSVLRQATIVPHRSGERGHSDHGWLNTYHSFSFANWHNPKFNNFGSLRVLNEDRVLAHSGFPTHPHRDFEIFSYIIAGELTHRDSMISKADEGEQSDKFFRMHRGDVQFTSGGTGISHSEMNEHDSETVHFLQIWAFPWKRGLAPRYHTRHFSDEDKRKDFVKILSPLKAGKDATAQEEEAAEPTIPNTIPIHADFVMGAGIIAPGRKFEWKIGGDATKETKRKVFVHLAMAQNGGSKIRLDGREDAELGEGDGAFVDIVDAGESLTVESIGEADAEVVILDTA